ncbi:MAG: Arc family DNA-binding protein [Spirochaetales bacterium]|nr:Arc family DNA-binding protein [Spirochaetales bacterium]
MNLSVKNVPPALAVRLRERARLNHRSLQGELLMILEQAVQEEPALTPTAVLKRARRLGLPRESSVEKIRASRRAH